MTLEETLAALDPWIRAEMERLHVPGLALGILDGEREHTACFGVTNLENPLAVDPRHAVPNRLDQQDGHRDRHDAPSR
ncbi:MAG: hypothetical protein M5U05_11970 [Anaerolineales bacterium]|nr:hypothetical protein [Anaerolineales bacterium]